MKIESCTMALKRVSFIIALSAVVFSRAVMSDPAPVPYHYEDYSVQSGPQKNTADSNAPTYSEIVSAPAGTPWMRVHFSNVKLAKGSYLLVESLLDGAQQRIDMDELKKWRNSSAYFNGDKVKVTFHAAVGEVDGFFNIDQITVGENVPVDSPESQCGTQDDRVSSNDPAIGRIVPVGCTGWLVANGATLTAGHCIGSESNTLEFNVPASLPDGTIQHPPIQDQYPIEPLADIDWISGGIGNDWAVFETFTNTNGRLAVHVQHAYYRMSRDLNTSIVSNVRVTGYGVDDTPPGSLGGGNSDNQTQQTHSGSYEGEVIQTINNIYLEYHVDTEGGNSGSPVIFEGTSPDLTMGIHTNAGCTSTGGSNKGTSFENDNLEAAIRDFYGTDNVEYVDKSHIDYTSEDGSVFRPHDTFVLGVNDAAARAGTPILSVVEGTYNETGSGSIIISDPMHIIAPVGAVIIK